ncbi:MAG: ORF6N domain-containing protein [Flavobacteriaceae bacterium]|nr:ORF6N domain-containing protein [Flavobacteriaceae bacterium]
MFELTKEEHIYLRSQFGTLLQNQHFRYPPFAFTEHGILMLSSILNSEIAIKMSVQIIETFVQLRKLANNYEEILNKIEAMESQYNEQFSEIYNVIKKLISEPSSNDRTKIGYNKSNSYL